MLINNLTPEQMLDKTFDGIEDSVHLIEMLILGQKVAQRDIDTIYRNYRHIEFVLRRDEVKASGRDLSPYQAAIETAKTYITESGVVPTVN